jgi:hypothetical protein
MPGAHRDTDSRNCGAQTIVENQSTVYVNGLLWAVNGDPDTHCHQGELSAIYGPLNVFINGINVICAAGDTAAPDTPDCEPPPHPPGATDPSGHSPNVLVYTGAAGGGS